MRFLLVSGLGLLLVPLAGCTRAVPASDSGSPTDVGTRDVGRDAPIVSCTVDADCNDTIACTFDQCVVGNLCQHTPLDAMCGAGEHCSLVDGCASGCNVDADCDDGLFCNGVEDCLDHACLAALMPPNCDDGMPCTVDSCDPGTDMCAYTTVCDSGVIGRDAGPICTPFASPADFAGTYLIAPSQNQGCGSTMYTVSTVVVSGGSSLTATGLRVDGSNVTMTGSGSGSSFTVNYSDGCGDYTLTGSFTTCRESFEGRWSATFSGSCGLCMDMDAAVNGLRR